MIGNHDDDDNGWLEEETCRQLKILANINCGCLYAAQEYVCVPFLLLA